MPKPWNGLPPDPNLPARHRVRFLGPDLGRPLDPPRPAQVWTWNAARGFWLNSVGGSVRPEMIADGRFAYEGFEGRVEDKRRGATIIPPPAAQAARPAQLALF